MVAIKRTTSSDTDFIALVEKLDAYLAEVDGDDHDFYDQFNGIDDLKQVVVAFDDGLPAGCGAIKSFNSSTMEIKRMYVSPEFRGRGIATAVLTELELWAKESGYTECILETGKRQKDAIQLYKKAGYQQFPNYGQYLGIENSICFRKKLM